MLEQSSADVIDLLDARFGELGKATRMATNNTAAPPSNSRAMLRYVIVVHATWIPDLRFAEDTFA